MPITPQAPQPDPAPVPDVEPPEPGHAPVPDIPPAPPEINPSPEPAGNPELPSEIPPVTNPEF